MNIAEIFGMISAHQVEGMMFHEQISDYYDFLALDGYACCHRWHYICETMSRSSLHKFYIENYDKLLMDAKVDAGSVIPTSWVGVSRFDVDANTKKSAVKSGVTEWQKWEKATYDLYFKMYKEILTLDEPLAADYVMKLMNDVNCEIQCAEKKLLKLTSVGFDLSYIYSEQDRILEKYSCPIDKVDKTIRRGT
jgi:hypothetical protein